MTQVARTRILFVCLGNICRSPTAEGIMRGLVADAGLESEVEIDSAGTGDWHLGESPDPRSVEAAAARGVELSGAARQVGAGDFEDFDMIIAMDSANRDSLLLSAPSEEAAGKVRMLREFGDGEALDVPDPWYAGGFDEVVEIAERNCSALLEDLRAAR